MFVGKGDDLGSSIQGNEIKLGSDARGDVMYRNATEWARLPAGNIGEYLKTGGAGANPSWSAIGGNVLTEQITDATEYNINDSTSSWHNIATLQFTAPVNCIIIGWAWSAEMRRQENAEVGNARITTTGLTPNVTTPGVIQDNGVDYGRAGNAFFIMDNGGQLNETYIAATDTVDFILEMRAISNQSPSYLIYIRNTDLRVMYVAV